MKIKNILFLIFAFLYSTAALAQGLKKVELKEFNPVGTNLVLPNNKIFGKSLEKRSDDEEDLEEQYDETIIEFEKAKINEHYSLALVYINKCIRICKEAKSYFIHIEDLFNLYEKKGDLLVLLEKEDEAVESYEKAIKYCEKEKNEKKASSIKKKIEALLNG